MRITYETLVTAALMLLALALIAATAYVLYLDANAEYINIKKSDWECTETSTTYWIIGNQPYQLEECIGYRKIK